MGQLARLSVLAIACLLIAPAANEAEARCRARGPLRRLIGILRPRAAVMRLHEIRASSCAPANTYGIYPARAMCGTCR